MVVQEKTSLGIELGSTRVKAVLLDEQYNTIATGGYEWRSRLVAGHWTYDLDEVWEAIQTAFSQVREAFRQAYGQELTRVGALGISAMMHGYLALDAQGQLLTGFRTWQDTTTGRAAEELSQLFQCNIPLRWSVAHVHQALLDDEEHVARLAYLNTLSGHVHWRLSGEHVLGVGDASGMFPIDAATNDYDATMLAQYDELVKDRNLPWTLKDVLPAVRLAGQDSGRLTEAGARLLDPSGSFQPGAIMAAPEGDAGTGMVATNSVRVKTANISAGTSIFAMVVLERPLSSMHKELDMVATPDGSPVVMVHCNNGANDLQDWVMLLGEAAQALGATFDTDTLFRTLYERSLEGAVDADGMFAFNYRAGEPITDLDEGRPLFVRMPESTLNLANFMRAHLYGALATLRLGFAILDEENVVVEEMFAHGGLFRTKGVAQRFLAAALDVPVTVGSSASEGGAWGMALLAAFRLAGAQSLPDWLDEHIFSKVESESVTATQEEIDGFQRYIERYQAAVRVEQTAVEALRRD